ncbi:MAG: hypothetical protein AAFP70_10115, partial [Calditrichota bacterium]
MKKGYSSFCLTLAIFCGVFFSTTLVAQTAPVAERLDSYMWHSGVHDGADNSQIFEMVYSSIVRVDNAPWLRLQFSSAYLGSGSYLRITSQLDGYQQ